MKNLLRTEAKAIRKLVHSEEKDYRIIENFKKTNEYKSTKNILIYMPIKNEINTLPLLHDNTKTFYIPRVKGENLEICRYNPNKLKTGSFGITEPCEKKLEDLSIIDNVIVPACAIDIKGFRLGYGKGYYDKFLKSITALKTVLIYEKLIFSTVFAEEHDIKCDMAVSENFILDFR